MGIAIENSFSPSTSGDQVSHTANFIGPQRRSFCTKYDPSKERPGVVLISHRCRYGGDVLSA